MDFQPWIGPLSLVATLAGIYYAHRQTKIMETQATEASSRAARRRAETIKLKWWRNPAIPVLLVLSGLAWSPYVFGINQVKEIFTLTKQRLLEAAAEGG